MSLWLAPRHRYGRRSLNDVSVILRAVLSARLTVSATPPKTTGSDISLPRHAQVVICGGGVIGASVAYHLAARGLTDVLLLEQGKLSCGTTWHAAGLVGSMRSGVMKELTSYSRNLYKWMESNNYPTGFKQCGRLNLAATKDRLISLRRVADECRAKKIEVHEISPKAVQEKFPWINIDDLKAGFWVPEDGVSSPTDVCVSMTRMATEKGVQVKENCRIERVLTSSDGSVKAVETSAGIVQCDNFVLCGGMWSRDLAAKTVPKVHVPLQPVEHFYLITKPIEGVGTMTPVVNDTDSFSYLREWGGGFLVGVFDTKSLPAFPDGPPPDFQFQLFEERWNHFQTFYDPVMRRFPFLNEVEVRQMTNGPESFTPDTKCLIGESPEVQRFFVATGMNSSGIALAGGVGRTISELIIDGTTSTDCSELDIKRCYLHQASRDFLRNRGQEVVGKHYRLSYPTQSQFETGRNVRMSALYGHHKWRGAIFGAVNDHEVPLWYPKNHEEVTHEYSFGKPEWFDSVGDEWKASKEGVIVADLTGLWGACSISCSRCALSLPLERLFYNDVRLPIGSLVKTGMLQPNGQYITECLLLSQANDRYLLVYPMATQTSVFRWLRHCLKGQNISVTDISSNYAFLTMLGPKMNGLLEGLQLPPIHSGMFNVATFGSSHETLILQHPLLPKDNIFGCVPKQNALGTFETLLSEGARPVGLHTIETLRVEEGISWWGHELNSYHTPLTAGKASEVLNQSKNFIGQSSLTRGSGVQRSHALIHFTIPEMTSESEAWPWGGEPILLGKSSVGSVTSVTYSFHKGAFVGLGVVDRGSPSQSFEGLKIICSNNQYDINVTNSN